MPVIPAPASLADAFLAKSSPRGERRVRASSPGSSGSGSSSGARGGSSSSGSSGTKGSSGGSSSGAKGSSAKPPKAVQNSKGGRRVHTGSQLPATQRNALYGPPGGQNFGYGRPLANGPALRFGFWPLLWTTDVAYGVAANNDQRPGGPLTPAALQAPGEAANVSYVIYADAQSVEVALPALQQTCQAVKATVPGDLSNNQTLQLYRDDSFGLLRFAAAGAPTNATFEACLNATIGDNLLVSQAATTQAPHAAACLVALVLGYKLR